MRSKCWPHARQLGDSLLRLEIPFATGGAKDDMFLVRVGRGFIIVDSPVPLMNVELLSHYTVSHYLCNTLLTLPKNHRNIYLRFKFLVYPIDY